MPDALTGSSGATPTTGFNSVTGASGTAATSAKPGGELDKDAFLKLLVAQLKYQKPMSPADPNEFLGQTAQFTMVEKLEEISKAQSDLTVWQKVTAGQSLVGRQVTGKSDLGSDVTGVVTGLALGTDELVSAALSAREALDAQIADTPEVAAVVAALEQQYDAFQAGRERSLLGSDGAELPTADELGAELERFLAEQRQEPPA